MCVQIHTVCELTHGVQNYTVVPFAFNMKKILSLEIFTLTPWPMWLTIMRYGLDLLNITCPAHLLLNLVFGFSIEHWKSKLFIGIQSDHYQRKPGLIMIIIRRGSEDWAKTCLVRSVKCFLQLCKITPWWHQHLKIKVWMRIGEQL